MECKQQLEGCPMEQRIKTLEDWRSESKKFHQTVYDWQRDQIARDAKLDVQLKNMEINLNKLVSWKEEEKAKPSKRWESIVDKILMMFVGAVFTFLLTQVGL